MSLLARLTAAKADRVPPGWLTLDQLARREGYAQPRCFLRVRDEALRAGFLERRDFRVLWGNFLRRRTHYRYTKPGQKRA